jgi:hypothetical protein
MEKNKALERSGAFAFFLVFLRGFWEKGVRDRGVFVVSLWWNAW